MIISFAWTTPALLAGAKTMTRRDWTSSHAMKFQRGMTVDAWDKLPRVRGSRKVATIRLTDAPYQQMSDALHPLDYRDEGFTWLVDHGWEGTVETVLRSWREQARMVWVVRFELVEVDGATLPRQGAVRSGENEPAADDQHFSSRRGGHGS